MRILADENFPRPIVESLRAEGHDVLWARTDLAGTSDTGLLDLAESEARIVLNADKTWVGHISIITEEGIQIVAARRR
ncbi:MAG: DUF5615 family PIN-like protein [Acidobacteria bacterium]|nr:DUF5615 family PIN-like protein [Acidobacteriota bacterium]